MPRDSCHVLHSTFNSHSFIVGALLNCFFTQSLLNLLLTTKKGNSIVNRQSSETGKILLGFGSLSHLLVFSLNDFPWWEGWSNSQIEVLACYLPFHIPSVPCVLYHTCSLGASSGGLWIFPGQFQSQVSSSEQKPCANILGCFLLQDLKDISVFLCTSL